MTKSLSFVLFSILLTEKKRSINKKITAQFYNQNNSSCSYVTFSVICVITVEKKKTNKAQVSIVDVDAAPAATAC